MLYFPMQDLPLFLIKDKKFISVICAIIILYTWSLFGRVSYISFLMGAFSVIVLEVVFAWNYLAARISKQNGDKITIDLGNSAIPF